MRLKRADAFEISATDLCVLMGGISNPQLSD